MSSRKYIDINLYWLGYVKYDILIIKTESIII